MFSAISTRVSPMIDGWSRFWFTPRDPSVLGAIRVVAGLIIFYTIAAFSLDLQETFGPHAWLDNDLAQEQYRYFPMSLVGFGWNDYPTRDPRTDQEREYAKAYIQQWRLPPPLPYPTSAREAQEYEEYHHKWGIDPRLLSGMGRPAWSIWFHVSDPAVMAAIQGFFVVSSFLFAIGFLTRLTSAFTWFAVLCYIHRSPATIFGADTMINILMMYLTIGPSGAAYSVDRLLSIRRARRQGLPDPEPKPLVSANLAIRLLQVHICIVYLSAGLAKLLGPMWWTGLAPWATVANFEYSPVQSTLYLKSLRLLTQNRLVFEASMTLLAIGTLAFEIGYAFLIWRPSLRPLILWAAVLLHAGIGICMGLKSFAVLMLAFNMAFLEPKTIESAIAFFLPAQWKRKASTAISSTSAKPLVGGVVASKSIHAR